MSEESIKSVSSNNSETIFLQAIDQQYEKGYKPIDYQEMNYQFNFFEEYDQKQNMNDMIDTLEFLNASTDSESLTASKNYSIKSEEENSNLKENKNLIKIKSMLIINWENNIEQFKKTQKNKLNFLIGQKLGPFVSQFGSNNNYIRSSDTFNTFNQNTFCSKDSFNLSKIKPPRQFFNRSEMYVPINADLVTRVLE